MPPDLGLLRNKWSSTGWMSDRIGWFFWTSSLQTSNRTMTIRSSQVLSMCSSQRSLADFISPIVLDSDIKPSITKFFFTLYLPSSLCVGPRIFLSATKLSSHFKVHQDRSNYCLVYSDLAFPTYEIEHQNFVKSSSALEVF